jgi:hypothetical protein
MARSVPIELAADEISVCPKTILRLLGKGDLKGHRVGRAVRVYLDSIEDYQRRNEYAPVAPAAPKRIRKNSNAHLQAEEALAKLGI